MTRTRTKAVCIIWHGQESDAKDKDRLLTVLQMYLCPSAAAWWTHPALRLWHPPRTWPLRDVWSTWSPVCRNFKRLKKRSWSFLTAGCSKIQDSFLSYPHKEGRLWRGFFQRKFCFLMKYRVSSPWKLSGKKKVGLYWVLPSTWLNVFWYF